MPNLWFDAVKLAAETAAQLRRDGKKMTEYRASGGKVVRGWKLKHLADHSETKGGAGSAWVEDYWDHQYLILGSDGKIYEYSESYTERRNVPGVAESKTLCLSSRQKLLGLGRGKPFAELTTLLERLPYT